jgi:hypothetical protein
MLLCIKVLFFSVLSVYKMQLTFIYLNLVPYSLANCVCVREMRCLCVCVCERCDACVCVCVCVCVCERERERERERCDAGA